jgi:FecR protein
MKTRKVSVIGIALAGILLALQAPVRMVAQEPPPQDQGQPPQSQGPAQDPPGRVARLSYSVGSVSFQPGGEGDWVQAVANRPLTTGDNLWADKDSRAELQTGSTSIRMDSETSVTFLDIDDHMTQLKLSQGSIFVRVRHLDDGDTFEIDTPNLAFQILRTGEYRVDVNADGNETDARVWSGRGEATGGGNSYVVVANQLARFTGTDQLNHDIEQIPAHDDFDNFAFQRDDREDHAESSNYISPEMTGASDLDEYGRWRYVADYGPVWTPVAVASGWAPYRYGHWVWVAPWGWTWVEDEPWGFAPFHYGRWAFVESSWCWVPGPVYVRPVYAPALVAFVGGGGFGVGVGVGVAWFPLAPREVYVPWYRTSPAYVNNVNITNTRVNVTQVTNVYNTTIINNNTTNVTRINYVNQHVTNGVTAVSHETFVNARPVNGNLAQVNQREIENAPVVHNIAAQPVRQSVMGAGRSETAKPPATVVNRQVVATRQPPPPRAPLGQGHLAEPNVRTEAPSQAQAARPAQPQSPRPTNTPRPEPPTMQANQPQHPQAPSNTANNRPAGSPNVPHPGAAQPQVPHPPVAQNGHPLVRPAPPVQENPQHQQNEQAKFNAWQQQRETTAQRPPQPHAEPHSEARAPQPAPHSEPHK